MGQGDIMTKIEREKETVALMIKIHCKGKHKSKELCEECSELLEYADKRLTACRYQNEKTFCSQCQTHCYKKDKKEQIKAVMKYSGPRMLFHQPMQVIKHVLNK